MAKTKGYFGHIVRQDSLQKDLLEGKGKGEDPELIGVLTSRIGWG